MERKKQSKGSVWEFCYANKIFGAFGFEIKACGQKLVTFCAHTHTHTHAAKLVVEIGLLAIVVVALYSNIISDTVGYCCYRSLVDYSRVGYMCI